METGAEEAMEWLNVLSLAISSSKSKSSCFESAATVNPEKRKEWDKKVIS